ncbi:hypothetical protein OH805_28540 [Streptomyces sp. NBC_00879]|uniref:hypothetical protein n=1 Tax=Streptomyces sp. NBC_00879 TaxID=2975855 RepID=UPI0038676345|nr:hypothetical protein OH805_28540 [Streptomyces sp. NBC_00879]
MFDRLEITLLPPGPRFPAQLRFWVNGEDVVEQAVGAGGRGPLAAEALPVGHPTLLRARYEPRRVQLGEPECTGGCCGSLSVIVQRIRNVVHWADWQVPHLEAHPLEFDFDASEYEAAVARAKTDSWWRSSA